MAQLHELLKQDQEPFHLKSFIADRQSQLKTKPSPKTTISHLKKRNPIPTNFCKHACFLSFQPSPDVRKSPFPTPPKSPNNAAVFLHIPSRTTALLVEAAMRIQKQPKSSQSKHVSFGLFGSFLKRIKDRNKCKKRVIKDSDFKDRNATTMEEKVDETVRVSCSCRRLSSADDWTESNGDKSMDFEASTSGCVSECSDEINGDFDLSETRFCVSPFRFSLHRSPSSSGCRTPEFCSPATSPCRRVKQEKENYESRNSDNVQGEEEEEKEQCSPVSVLDPPFEDDGRESRDAEEDEDEDEDDFDVECSYGNALRAKQQLLYRLRRFEKLAELDPIELERKLMEGYSDDDEDHEEREESDDDDEPLSLYKKQSVETFVTQALNQSHLQYQSRIMSTDMKRLVSDLIVEEKSGMIHSGTNEVVIRRICKRLDSWKEVEFNTIDMMVGLDLKGEVDRWTKFDEQVEMTAADIELAIYTLLIEELSDELLYNQEMDMVSC